MPRHQPAVVTLDPLGAAASGCQGGSTADAATQASARSTLPHPAPAAHHPGAAQPSARHTGTSQLAEPSARQSSPAPSSSPETASGPPPAEPSPSEDQPWPSDWLQRTTLLLGPDGVQRLRGTRVLVVGLGGVGSYVAEFLVRAGVGSLAIVDGDVVDVSNKNRQLPALDSTVGQPKAHVMSQRLLDINPQLNLVVRQEFLVPDEAGGRLLDEVAAALARSAAASGGGGHTAPAGCGGEGGDAAGSQGAGTAGHVSERGTTDDGAASGAGSCMARAGGGEGSTPAASPPAPAAAPGLDWVVDCIDSIAPKLALVAAARARGARVVSSMGAGGRLDPLAVRVADVADTFGDPFAATVRRSLRRDYGIRDGVTVVFSTEPCRRASLALTSASRFKRSYYGTISFIPAVFGLHIAAHIINSIVDGPMLASEAAHRQELALLRDAAVGGELSRAAKAKAKAEARARSMAGIEAKRQAQAAEAAAGVGAALARPPGLLRGASASTQRRKAVGTAAGSRDGSKSGGSKGSRRQTGEVFGAQSSGDMTQPENEGEGLLARHRSVGEACGAAGEGDRGSAAGRQTQPVQSAPHGQLQLQQSKRRQGYASTEFEVSAAQYAGGYNGPHALDKTPLSSPQSLAEAVEGGSGFEGEGI